MAAAARQQQGEALRRIVDALGGVARAATAFEVSTWTVRAWLDGSRLPTPMRQRRLNAIAHDLGLPAPWPQWDTGVRRREPAWQIEAVGRLTLELTDEERRFGFARAELAGRDCVAAELRPGLFAVRVHHESGAREYAICNERLRPLYRAAASLRELSLRFPGP